MTSAPTKHRYPARYLQSGSFLSDSRPDKIVRSLPFPKNDTAFWVAAFCGRRSHTALIRGFLFSYFFSWTLYWQLGPVMRPTALTACLTSLKRKKCFQGGWKRLSYSRLMAVLPFWGTRHFALGWSIDWRSVRPQIAAVKRIVSPVKTSWDEGTMGQRRVDAMGYKLCFAVESHSATVPLENVQHRLFPELSAKGNRLLHWLKFTSINSKFTGKYILCVIFTEQDLWPLDLLLHKKRTMLWVWK